MPLQSFFFFFFAWGDWMEMLTNWKAKIKFFERFPLNSTGRIQFIMIFLPFIFTMSRPLVSVGIPIPNIESASFITNPMFLKQQRIPLCIELFSWISFKREREREREWERREEGEREWERRRVFAGHFRYVNGVWKQKRYRSTIRIISLKNYFISVALASLIQRWKI